MDEPVPVRRAAIGCLVIALAGLAVALIVRPAIFTFAPERGDAAVVVATATEVLAGPVERDVLLSRSYGWTGEREGGGGRVQLRIIVSPVEFGGVAAVAGTSPGSDGCAVEVGPDGLADCVGRRWSFEGEPADPGDAPLDRFPVMVESGSVTVDLTRRLEPETGTIRASAAPDAPARRT
jgi:hypothetical protein